MKEHNEDNERGTGNEENDNNSDNNEDTRLWNDENVILLIRLVESNYNNFQNQLKKNVWNRIASELSGLIKRNVTGIQCDTKWKNLKKMYKSIQDHNNKSGNSKKTWLFFEAMNNFLFNKPEITPLSTCSSNSGMTFNIEEDSSGVESSGNTNEAGSSRKRKRDGESAQERRHMAKITRQDKFLELFGKLVDHVTKEK